jgi:aspartate aminotransferase
VSLPVSRRVQRVKPSPILAATARAARLKAEGRDVIGLAAGEPDFDTPRHIAQAGVDAIKNGFTRYTGIEALNELKEAVIAKFERDNGIRYERAQILISAGPKQTIYNLCMAVLDPGDEAIIPAPYCASYPDMVLLADGLPVTPFAGAPQGYKITPRQLAAAITPKTRLVLLNSPCNPTGAAYTRAELRALGEVVLQYPRIVIGADDTYEKIYWGGEPFCSLLTAVPELYGRTVTINGVSEAYAMAGWRLGYCGGPKEIITAMATIQGQSTSSASSVSQKAALAALNGDQSCVTEMSQTFKARQDFIVAGLNALPGVSCTPGVGTFYAFADVSRAMAGQGCRDDSELAELLLERAGVAVLPGGPYGAAGHICLSFACSMQTLETALDRMHRVLAAGPVVAKTA